MRRMRWIWVAGIMVAITAGVYADTSLTAYGTYWDADDPGKGGGLRLKKTFLGFMAVEGRGGYIEFADSNTDMMPVDASINVRLPFMISPYAGVGAAYYFMDSDQPNVDNMTGSFVQVGVEATLVWFGAMAEIRYNDVEGNDYDDTSFNAGLLLKW